MIVLIYISIFINSGWGSSYSTSMLSYDVISVCVCVFILTVLVDYIVVFYWCFNLYSLSNNNIEQVLKSYWLFCSLLFGEVPIQFIAHIKIALSYFSSQLLKGLIISFHPCSIVPILSKSSVHFSIVLDLDYLFNPIGLFISCTNTISP